MLFNSYIFILLFLPAMLIGYFGLNHCKKYSLAQGFLLLMSLWFYGYFNPSYLLIILVSIVANYGFSRLICKSANTGARKALLLLAVLSNVGVLFYFKYYDFFFENINHIFRTNFVLKNIMLPLGISFFTFQQISYVVDSYRGEVDEYDFLKYASFVVYFPQLIAGPIVTHDELIPQFMDESKKTVNWDNLAKGIYIFVLGLAKKVLIADVFGIAVEWGYGRVAELNSTNAILTVLAYTFQVYFDFSGYCDMAIGLAKMMNFDLPLNFNSPYKAKTITEFWDRWHITLSRFFTRYVYIPLGGNRQGKLCTYRNIMIVYLISGIWHGANYTFIIWGVLHGVCTVFTKHFSKFIDRVPAAVNWLLTFLFVNLAWVFFRAESVTQAFEMLGAVTAWDFGPVHTELPEAFHLVEFSRLFWILFDGKLQDAFHNMMIWLYYAGGITAVLGTSNAFERMQKMKCSTGRMIWTALLCIWCVLSFSGVSTFLYFNF